MLGKESQQQLPLETIHFCRVITLPSFMRGPEEHWLSLALSRYEELLSQLWRRL